MSRLRVLLVLLAGALAVLCIAGSAFAVPKDPIDPPPPDDGGGGGTTQPYVPPANGFEWSLASRFGALDQQGIVNYHWNSLEGPRKWNGPVETYDPSYVHPTQFDASFDGCTNASEEAKGPNDATDNTYAWSFGDGSATLSGHHCNVTHSYGAQGAYSASLTVTSAAGVASAPVTQTVRVKDLLIVSMGDSYGSGEGNPEKPLVQGNTFFPSIATPALWEDRRCHRSSKAGPAQAALAIERSDPHTSVTFISFACSGATIDARSFADTSIFDPYTPNDWNKDRGSGILGSYTGAEPPDQNNLTDRVPSQIDQLKDAVGSRHIDALLMSGGGNDAGFGNIATVCVMYGDCPNHDVLGAFDEGPRSLNDRFFQDLANLRTSYDKLATALADPANGLDIAKTYITEYVDSTRNDHGDVCDAMLDDVIGWPLYIDKNEATWAGDTVVANLDLTVKAAAARHGWTYVDGISDLFKTHGYCAQNSFIRRASDSAVIEGPLSAKDTKGTLHPNAAGQTMYAQRILAYLKPDLVAASAAPPVTPTFDSGSSAFGATAQSGSGGWLTGECNGSCASDFTVASVSAATSAGIAGAQLTINGGDCASVGATCTPTATTVGGLVTGYRWDVKLPNDGVYRLDATVTGKDGGTASYSREVKVDLHDPTNATAAQSASVPGAAGWYRVPVTVTFGGNDAPGGSGIASIDYSLDGGATQTATAGTTITVSGEGSHALTWWAVDVAGRQGGGNSAWIRIDTTAPSVQCGQADNAWHADNVSVDCWSSDNGVGVSDANGAFSLSTTVAQGDESSFASTGSREVCDLVGNCVTAGPVAGFAIDRKAPSVTCASADTAWHADNVSLDCNSIDRGAGVSDAAGSFALTTSVAAGEETADASTGSNSVCDNVGNCVTVGPVGGIHVDRKAPVLTVPAATTVDATTPAGAAVTFAATAVDGTDASPAVTCTPASGSTFAAGTKTVTCVARDHAGNTSTGSFTVTVRGAAQQVANLVVELTTMLKLPTPAAPLRALLETASTNIVQKRPQVACATLKAFATAVHNALPLFLTTDQKAQLTADANRIRAVIGC